MDDMKSLLEEARKKNPLLPAHEAVADILRLQIATCVMRQGQHLKEIETAEKMGVSRSTVRRTFETLVLEGTVRRTTYGVEVAPMLLRQYAEVAELRRMLDSFASNLAAQKRSNKDVEELHDWIERLMQANTVSPITEADVGFHNCIYRAAGNMYMLQISRLFGLDIMRSKYLSAEGVIPIRNRIVEEHTKIYEAIRQRDAAKAYSAAIKHAQILMEPYFLDNAYRTMGVD